MQNKKRNIVKNPFRNGRVFCFILFLFFIIRFTYSQPLLNVLDSKKNFGFVKKGEVVRLSFEVINKGSEPLIFSDYKVECSCTQVILPKQPVLPNHKDSIIVQFDTKTVYDRQDRIVEINSNSKNGIQKIRFKGVVLK